MMELLSGLLTLSVLVYAVSSMLLAGMGSELSKIIGPLRNIGATSRALLANFVLVPLLALIVLRALDPPQALANGLFLTGTAAGAPFLIKLATTAEADVALSTTQLLVLLPVTIVYMPLVVPLALPWAEISAAAIARPLLLSMLLPLAIGLLLRAVAKPWAMALQPILGKISSFALLVLIATTILVNLPGILPVFRTTAILAAVLLIAGAFAIGYVLGGRTLRRREVLGLATGQRNIAAAAVVASQAVGHPDTITMVVVTSLVGFAVLFPLAWLLRRRSYAPVGEVVRRPPDGG